MKGKLLIYLIVINLVSCKSISQHKEVLEINLNGMHTDTCITFKNKSGNVTPVSREFEILKNTVSDTIAIGGGIIQPNYRGKLLYLFLDNRTDVLLDPKVNFNYQPKLHQLCIQSYKGKRVSGKLVLQYLPQSNP